MIRRVGLLRYMGQGHWQHPFHETEPRAHPGRPRDGNFAPQQDWDGSETCWMDAWNFQNTGSRDSRQADEGIFTVRVKASAGIFLGTQVPTRQSSMQSGRQRIYTQTSRRHDTNQSGGLFVSGFSGTITNGAPTITTSWRVTMSAKWAAGVP